MKKETPIQFRCFPVDSVKFLRTFVGGCCYLQKKLKIAYVLESSGNMTVQ